LQHDSDLRAQVAPISHRIEAEHAHGAGIGLAVALEDLDGCRLAGSVRTEQSSRSTARVDPYDFASATTEIAGSAVVTAQESRHAT
jgi:hypothetical protein